MMNAGDTAGVAHAMKRVGYYSGNEGLYKKLMKDAKANLDRQLGPVSAE